MGKIKDFVADVGESIESTVEVVKNEISEEKKREQKIIETLEHIDDVLSVLSSGRRYPVRLDLKDGFHLYLELWKAKINNTKQTIFIKLLISMFMAIVSIYFLKLNIWVSIIAISIGFIYVWCLCCNACALYKVSKDFNSKIYALCERREKYVDAFECDIVASLGNLWEIDNAFLKKGCVFSCVSLYGLSYLALNVYVWAQYDRLAMIVPFLMLVGFIMITAVVKCCNKK